MRDREEVGHSWRWNGLGAAGLMWQREGGTEERARRDFDLRLSQHARHGTCPTALLWLALVCLLGTKNTSAWSEGCMEGIGVSRWQRKKGHEVKMLPHLGSSENQG